jgi:hypothetical protein
MGAEVFNFEHGAALQGLKPNRPYQITHRTKGIFSIVVKEVTVSCVPVKGGGEREMVWVRGVRVGCAQDRPSRRLRAADGEPVILMGLLVKAARGRTGDAG